MDIFKQILDFINAYYHVFIIILCVGLFVLTLVKPNKKSDIARVIEYVNKAEELFPEPGSGAIKLAYVIKQLSDIDPTQVIKLVDEVLSSPEKKK